MRTSSKEDENSSRLQISFFTFSFLTHPCLLQPHLFPSQHLTSLHASTEKLRLEGTSGADLIHAPTQFDRFLWTTCFSFCFFPFSQLIQPHPPSLCLLPPSVLLFTIGDPKQYVRMSRAVYGQKENEDVVEQIRCSRRWWRRRKGGRRCWGDQGYAKDWGSGFVVGRNAVSVL